ncbi:uncharacterized protein CHD9NB isoform X2 [Artibeus jamaicensis]|uniref:uncharacterized protein CHD9NB isoform X2 n=1 Tax=Artibeus jamaicensis TaxID=9417 RepID=UPI00235A9104|nr:uncharacterized protein CHD9NB isoform X2 [Artibeus jamaicensis]
MGCHTSKTATLAVELQEPGKQPSGAEPNLEAGAEAVDHKETPLQDGAAEPQS